MEEPRTDEGLTESAPRRTWLAAERTYLAWLRTGMAALGLSLAVGRLLPALIDASHIAFGLLGAGLRRVRHLPARPGRLPRASPRAALVARRPVPTDYWEITALTVFSVILGIATVVLIFVEV